MSAPWWATIPRDEFESLVAAMSPRDRAEALERLTLVAEGATGKGDPLRQALLDASDGRALIEPEQAKIREQIARETNETKAAYLQWQHDLVALQLTRAADSADARLQHLRELDTDEKRAAELAKCASDTLYWFHWYAWGMDPRSDTPLALQPFVPFEFQEKSILWTDDLVFSRRSDGIIEKSRDMGATWEKVDWAIHKWLFIKQFSALFGSINEDKIDKAGEPDTLFEKARIQLRLLPKWMLPKGFDWRKHSTFMHLENPELSSVLVGEAPTVNFGRSGRYSAILLDELAFWLFRGRPQWVSCSQSSRSKIVFSSVQGKRTQQYELRQSGLPVLTLHWRDHPWKDTRWYDGQALSMSRAAIRQELDIDYTASLTGLLLPEWNEVFHVITWSEFAKIFGTAALDKNGKPRIPARGYIAKGMDVGMTADHPSAVLYGWRPMEGMPCADKVFFYRELCFPEWPEPTDEPVSIGRIADVLYAAEQPWGEWGRQQTRLMSHEQLSARRTFLHDVRPEVRQTWNACAFGARDGLPELQNYLRVDYSKPHPCAVHPQDWPVEAERGTPIMGDTRLFVVVDDEQGALYTSDAELRRLARRDPVNAAGFARSRAEIPQYHLPSDTQGEEKAAVKPLFNDAVDVFRMLAKGFFITVEPMTAHEQAERHVAQKFPDLNLELIGAMEDPNAQAMSIIARMAEVRKAVKTFEQAEEPVYNFRIQEID